MASQVGSIGGGHGGEDGLAEAARSELERVLANPEFQASPRRRKMLRYLVEEALAGRENNLTGVPIAQSVFGRDESFDHQSDPVVRIEARRLRRDLDSYYAGPGSNDPVRITVPKGRYVPLFEWRRQPVSPGQVGAPDPTAGSPAARGLWGTSEGLIAQPYRAVLAAAVALALVLVVFWTLPSGSDDASVEMERPLGPVLAVMPLNNIGSTESASNIGYGMAEQLATEFLRFGSLRILATGALKPEQIQFVDPQGLREELNVDFVLDGHYRVSDDEIRIAVRLIDTASSEYVWNKEYVRQFTPKDIYRLQDDIVSEVTGNIAGKYGVVARSSMERSSRTPPEGLSAYQCVLDYYAYQSVIESARNREIVQCLEQTVRDEPDYAEAWAILANLYMQEKRFGFSEEAEQAVEKARSAVSRAVELAPESSTGHLMMSNLLFTENDLEGFREHGDRALELNPNDPDLLAHYGMRLTFLGELERGIGLVDRAVELNPTYPSWYRFARIVYHFELGEYEPARDHAEKIDMPAFFWKPLWMATLSVFLDDRETADAEMKKLLEIQPDFDRNGVQLMRYWHFSPHVQESIIKSLGSLGLRMHTS